MSEKFKNTRVSIHIDPIKKKEKIRGAPSELKIVHLGSAIVMTMAIWYWSKKSL
jgi:hypothetical protein